MSDLEGLSEEFNRLFATLGDDVHRAIEAAHDVGDQYSYRQFVRAAFAMQEGMIYATKQMALAIDDDERLLTPPERALLSEISYELGERGDLKERPANLPMLRNIRFAFKTFAKASQADYVLAVGEDGWEKLRKATIIRNRLTHPKSSTEAYVEPDDVEVVRQAHFWFGSQLLALMEAATSADTARLELLEVELAKLERQKNLALAELVQLRAQINSSRNTLDKA